MLDRKLSERRIFPAIDIPKTSTRREDLLLSAEEMEAINVVRRALNGMKSDEAVDKVLDLFAKTKTNVEFVQTVKDEIPVKIQPMQQNGKDGGRVKKMRNHFLHAL